MSTAPGSLRPRFRAVLEYMLSYVDEHGYAPTLREIVAATDYESISAVNHALRQLANAGHIRLGDGGQARAIDVRPAKRRSKA